MRKSYSVLRSPSCGSFRLRRSRQLALALARRIQLTLRVANRAQQRYARPKEIKFCAE